MVWNKGLTKEDPRVAKYLKGTKLFQKGHKNHPNWHKALKEGRINPPGGWNKNLSSEEQPGFKGGRQKTGNGYFQILMPSHPKADKRGRIMEHRHIMEQHLGRYLLETEYIDHINNDSSDNRIENLRLCTRSQNQANRGKQLNNTTGYKNIYLDKDSGKYYVQVGFEGKTYSFGHHIKLADAIQARNKALKKLHEEFAKLD